MPELNYLSRRTMITCAAVSILIIATAYAASAADSFIGPLNIVKTVASTIPGNGDINPYGVARVPASTGKLIEGHILISNFNNTSNLQGTGHHDR